MYQTIGESIEVIGVYGSGRRGGSLPLTFRPLRFRWGKRVYRVEQITLVAEVKDGGVPGRSYSVVVGGTVYRLYFNRTQENWILKELWVE